MEKSYVHDKRAKLAATAEKKATWSGQTQRVKNWAINEIG